MPDDAAPLKPGDLIALGFLAASARQRPTHQAWITASFRGSGSIPRLISSIQRMGELDLVLRCMEDDWRRDGASTDVSIMRDSLQWAMSGWWISGMYEIARVQKQRSFRSDAPDFAALAEDLRLIRVPLEKHELPDDRKLEEPMAFATHPPREGDTPYLYDKTDPQRHHNISSGMSERGSVVWNVISVKPAVESRWLERRGLSERFLALWAPSQPAPDHASS